MNEISLIRQAQQEKSKKSITSAFSKLVMLYQVRLYNYLLARCHNSYDAEDIVQETFINAYKYLNSYNSKWQFSTWLFTIANRLIGKQMKMYGQSSEIVLKEETYSEESFIINPNNIWLVIKRSLNSKAYDVLWFFYVEGFSIKEISKILQKSKSWVKITLLRSKKKLSLNNEIKLLSQDYLA